MLYNARSNEDGAGTASINPAYLSLTTNVRPGTYATDTTYPTADPYSHAHTGRTGHQNTDTSSWPAGSYPALYTGPDSQYVHWTGSLPEADSAAQLPVHAEEQNLEDRFPPSRSQASRDCYPDSWDLLQQSLHNPALLAHSDEDGSLTEHAVRHTHTASGPSRLAPSASSEPDIALAGAVPWSEVLLAPDYDSLRDALFSPAEGSSKKRKVHDLDPGSDVEDVSGAGTSAAKKRKMHDKDSAPTAKTDVEEGPESSTKLTKSTKPKSAATLEKKKVSSKKIRDGHKDGIEDLRRNQKLFPNPRNKEPTKAEVIRAVVKYVENSTPQDEVDQLGKRLTERISALEQEHSKSMDEVKRIEAQLGERIAVLERQRVPIYSRNLAMHERLQRYEEQPAL